jgi:hypothetical protein
MYIQIYKTIKSKLFGIHIRLELSYCCNSRHALKHLCKQKERQKTDTEKHTETERQTDIERQTVHKKATQTDRLRKANKTDLEGQTDSERQTDIERRTDRRTKLLIINNITVERVC